MVYPDGYDISVEYLVSELIVSLDDSIIVTYSITNNETFPLKNLYLCENLPPELEIKSFSIKIDDIESEFYFEGPLEDNLISGFNSYYWLIDEPATGDILNIELLPGQTVSLEYQLASTALGLFSLQLHSTCFYGNGTGFFSTGNSITVAVVSNPGCGDANNDSEMNILDIIFMINYKYKDGPPPLSLNLIDVNNDGTMNILDIVYLIGFIYKDGPEPNCPE